MHLPPELLPVVQITLPVVVSIAVLIWIQNRTSRRWRAEVQWREHPDPAAVQAQRQLWADGEFRRHVLDWSPVDVDRDRGNLSCGHYILRYTWSHSAKETEVDCRTCAEEYLEQTRVGA